MVKELSYSRVQRKAMVVPRHFLGRDHRSGMKTCSMYIISHRSSREVKSGGCSGEENMSVDVLESLVHKTLKLIESVPEDKDARIDDLCDQIELLVKENSGIQVNMDLLTRVQQGDVFWDDDDDDKTDGGLKDDIVERLGARLTSLYFGSDFGSLDRANEYKTDTNMNAMQTVASGNLVPSKSVDLQRFEEQAQALEATIGKQKAQSIVELLGRKSLSVEEMERIQSIPEKSDAERILEALLCIEDERERKELMEEAFIPVSAVDMAGNTQEVEVLSTTPMALYQVIRSWQHNYEETASIEGVTGVPFPEVQRILEELRRDVLDSLDKM